jgi:hypothetical protein
MLRYICAACISCLLFSACPQKEAFTKYKAIEAYEVQPGILAFPAYNEYGMVCEIGIERRQYTQEKINLDPSLSPEEIDRIVDQLAPPEVRGQKSTDLPNDGALFLGPGRMTLVQYENVRVETFTKVTAGMNVALVIQWKNRNCKSSPSETGQP